MKKFLALLLVLVLLAGCAPDAPPPTAPTTEPTDQLITPPLETEPPLPWVQAVGLPWDAAGALLELPLTIPDGLHYDSAQEFAGDLLLWSLDTHLPDTIVLELCLVELDSGTVSAQADIPLTQYTMPQVLGDRLYLCDSTAGQILELDKSLTVLHTWQTTPSEGNWYMGGSNTLYCYDWEGGARLRDLDTGEERPLLPDTEVSYLALDGDLAQIEYYDPDTGESVPGLVDVSTGALLECPIAGRFSNMDYRNGTWLCSGSRGTDVCYIGSTEAGLRSAFLEGGGLSFLTEDTLLLRTGYGDVLSLHDLDGTARGQCRIGSGGIYCHEVIPNEALGGYFCLLSEESGFQRLLFWDPSQGERGQDILFEPAPEPSEAEQLVADRAAALSEQYGVIIRVGADCDTEFSDITAKQVTDWAVITASLDKLEQALSVYPEGFFQQIRYADIHTVEIWLVGDLRPTSDFHPSLAGFTSSLFDKALVVLDVYQTSVFVCHHEFSHLIDSCLFWDSLTREDALFSEDQWAALNPDWFPGYSNDYREEHLLQNDGSFFDTYSTTYATEDRARVWEHALMDYNSFEGHDVLQKKLDYYCRCIRDTFDTTGWPEELPWEQYCR